MNLVTGATGILGSHVAFQLLQADQRVLAVRRSGSDISKVRRLFNLLSARGDVFFERIEWTELDILDIFSIESALQQVTTVYHCAGLVSFDPRNRAKVFEVNEKGTRNLVNACLHNGNVVLCHVSSIATLHNLEAGAEINESVFWKKSGRESDYAISKYNAEREVWRGIEEGLKAVIVNPGVILGAGFEGQSSSALLDTGRKGNAFYPPGSAAFVSANDLALVMIGLVEQQAFGERFIVVGRNCLYRDFLSLLNESFGNRPPRFLVSRRLLRLGAFFDGLWCRISGRERKITAATVHSVCSLQQYSSRKVTSRLGFTFEPLEKTLRNIAETMSGNQRKTH